MAAATCRLVTLDVTGTCIKVNGSVGSHYVRHVYRHTGVKLDEKTVEKEFRLQFKEMDRDYPNFGCYSASMNCKMWWDTVVEKTLRGSGYVDNTNNMVNICHSLYTDFSTKQCWSIYDDLWPFIKRIKNSSKTVKLGAISNFDERLETILEGLGLREFFDFVLVSYNERTHKPHPRLFYKALDISKASELEAWHIGNDYVRDYQAATSAGLNAVLLLREGEVKLKKDLIM
ncbi:PREDICTED: haloacid dehalogenase-like hydrolase domain-containing protein 3 isoform X2 [Amphimedon queenslandica]|uniref:Haloacid dehalogenase-like hydrolase domain-containing protein 3 n=1 Tax=Amphimedon queenslandica TaxID=400682 RepID=A0AAN0J2X6_AMPQE|nr:PREDICTED: haloacid dehalogenase-like hydrolase domain-containing protein 3 isoform X2 [Amphimedon queenslandica]|eukprot:XP_019851389.1 PREDICTED: haloacid dehalogenase-like hydrolase domain-containing protein 3 isoform X2 [Amphimedon queenslandica]